MIAKAIQHSERSYLIFLSFDIKEKIPEPKRLRNPTKGNVKVGVSSIKLYGLVSTILKTFRTCSYVRGLYKKSVLGIINFFYRFTFTQFDD